MQAIKKQPSGGPVLTSRMLVVIVAGLGLFSAGAYAAESVSLPHFKVHAPYVPGEVLVKFRSLPGQVDVAAAHAAIGAQTIEELPVVKVHRVRGTQKQSTQALMRYYAKRADVEYVEPNYIYTTQIIPNDPRFAEMWGLHNIGQTGGTADRIPRDAPTLSGATNHRRDGCRNHILRHSPHGRDREVTGAPIVVDCPLNVADQERGFAGSRAIPMVCVGVQIIQT